MKNKKKFSIPLILLLAMMAAGCFSSCTINSFDATSAILGKWAFIAEGPSSDQMSYRSDMGVYWEFLDDGTLKWCIPKFTPLQEGDIDNYHINLAQYSIDAQLLVIKKINPDDGTCYGEDCYTYKIYNGKLQLTREPIIPDKNKVDWPHTMEYIANIFIFNHIN